MKTIKVRTSYVPDDCDYLTPGKVYEAMQFTSLSENLVAITDDTGDDLFLRLPSCAHLGGQPWEVIDE